MPPPPATASEDALSKCGLWDDQESLKTVVVALLWYDHEQPRELFKPDMFMEPDIVAYHLASKGGKYEDMDEEKVTEIWDCIKAKAGDERNPYRQIQALHKDKSNWETNEEVQDIMRDLFMDGPKAKTKAQLAEG